MCLSQWHNHTDLSWVSQSGIPNTIMSQNFYFNKDVTHTTQFLGSAVFFSTIYTTDPCMCMIRGDYLHTWISGINGLTEASDGHTHSTLC
jgi:hypothetical protein